MKKYMGFELLINRGMNPGLSILNAFMLLLLSGGEYPSLYVDPDIIFFSAAGNGAMLSKWNRESGITKVSTISWG